MNRMNSEAMAGEWRHRALKAPRGTTQTEDASTATQVGSGAAAQAFDAEHFARQHEIDHRVAASGVDSSISLMHPLRTM